MDTPEFSNTAEHFKPADPAKPSKELDAFVKACRKVDKRLTLTRTDEQWHVEINNYCVCIDGYNFPYQAFLITQFMKRQGSFE